MELFCGYNMSTNEVLRKLDEMVSNINFNVMF